MNTFVVSGLIKRRAELAGDIEQAHEALRKMVLDLENLDATIVQFEPDFRVETIKPKAFRRARACARYGVLVVGEEMKGLVNCNFLPGSARRLELGTVSAEPLSRAYWSQKLRPLGETVGLSRARTSGESPDSTQAGRGPQWPIQLAAISAHPAAMVGTGMPKLRGRTGNEP
jgi:hypothetical protein